jgi:hypothetical protein
LTERTNAAARLDRLPISPLCRSYGVGGVLAFMIGLLFVQIFVVFLFGIEPKKRSLEEIFCEVSTSAQTATL